MPTTVDYMRAMIGDKISREDWGEIYDILTKDPAKVARSYEAVIGRPLGTAPLATDARPRASAAKKDALLKALDAMVSQRVDLHQFPHKNKPSN